MKKMQLKEYVAVFGTGFLFAIGLALSGMTLPSKVVGFFDFSEGLSSWDPSLAFVMGGGMLLYLPVYRIVSKRRSPLLASEFRLPTRRDIDLRLVGGAALFGVGWGLGGYCPGPALASFGTMSKQALIVVVSMLVGMAIFQQIDKLLASTGKKKDPGSGAEAEPS